MGSGLADRQARAQAVLVTDPELIPFPDRYEPPLVFPKEILAAGWQLHLEAAANAPVDVTAKHALKCDRCAVVPASNVRLLHTGEDTTSFGRDACRPAANHRTILLLFNKLDY